MRPSGGAPFIAVLLTAYCCTSTPSPHRLRLQPPSLIKTVFLGGLGGPAQSSAVPLRTASQLCWPGSLPLFLCDTAPCLPVSSSCLQSSSSCARWQCSGHRPGLLSHRVPIHSLAIPYTWQCPELLTWIFKDLFHTSFGLC